MNAFSILVIVCIGIMTVMLISIVLVHAEPFTISDKFTIERIFQGHFSPSTMSFLGKDDFLILDRDRGMVYRVTNGRMLDQPLIDVNVATVGYRGMLGIAVSNDFHNHTNVFLYYTQAHKKDGEDQEVSNPLEPLGNRIYKYELVNNRLANPKLLLNLPAMPGPRHMGGIIAIGPDNNLYISVGDLDGTFRGKNYDTMAQNYQNSTIIDGRSGILRVTQDGRPVGKGILGNTYPLNLYYAYGIRNSFGFDWDPISDKLWDTENGPHFGDEINLVEPGFNSGWVKVQGIWEPNFEELGRVAHNPKELVSFKDNGRYSEPEFIWIPTIAPTGLIFFNSNNYGLEYKNTLFVGDANTGTVYNFKLNATRTGLQLDGTLIDKIANTMSESKKVTFATDFGRITDIDLGPDGLLYILSTQNHVATVYRISPR